MDAATADGAMLGRCPMPLAARADRGDATMGADRGDDRLLRGGDVGGDVGMDVSADPGAGRPAAFRMLSNRTSNGSRTACDTAGLERTSRGLSATSLTSLTSPPPPLPPPRALPRLPGPPAQPPALGLSALLADTLALLALAAASLTAFSCSSRHSGVAISTPSHPHPYEDTKTRRHEDHRTAATQQCSNACIVARRESGMQCEHVSM